MTMDECDTPYLEPESNGVGAMVEQHNSWGMQGLNLA